MWIVVASGLVVFVSALFGSMGYRGRPQVVGIDLGTTFSVVALKNGDEVTVLPDWRSGKALLPSVVSFFPEGRTVVGHEAVRLRDTHPSNTIFNAKRFIGRPFDEVTEDARSHPFHVAPHGSDAAGKASPLAGFVIPGAAAGGADGWVSPVDVGAEVVRHLKRSVAEHLGFQVGSAVICVPAKFSPRETKATREAFERAGFRVARVLEEPTAAAVAYNLHKGSGVRHVLVYDIGGGTLDTSLLYMNGKAISMLGVAGDDHLGGSDFDQRMRDLLLAKLAAPGAQDAEAEAPAGEQPAELHSCDRNGLHILGEEAKIKLSSVLSTTVRCRAEGGGVRSLTVTRQEFEEASADLFRRSMEPVEKVLEDQMMTSDNIDDIVLVGGASRTPRLRALLQEFFGEGKRLHTEIDPDVTVAYGAANILD